MCSIAEILQIIVRGVYVKKSEIRLKCTSLFQSSKLKVHPAPGVHISVAGCTGFRTCAPGRCMLFPILYYDHIEMSSWTFSRMHGF